jgi:type IX secretion system PorP/SprF family membrane protein
MKRKILILTLLLSSVSGVFSQQVEAYKFYLADDYLLNPAYSGTNNYYSINLGVDQRFSGINVSPETAFISVHSKVGKGYLFEKDGKINRFFSKFGNSSFGFQFFQYRFGAQYESNLGLTYGHHIKLSPPFMTKNPRTLVLALTPRFQSMGLKRGDLILATTSDGATSMVFDPLIPGDLESNPKAFMFKLDVGALYQTVHADLGLSALNVNLNRNSFETHIDNLVDSIQPFDMYDSIYSPILVLNGKLKYLNIVDEDKLLIKFVPSAALLYAYKRQTLELFVDLALESTFFKIIAQSRKQDYMTGKIGVNINHTRYWQPTTYMKPYISFDYKNYVISYSYTYILNSDIMNQIWGANQITFGVKLGYDRVVTGLKRSDWQSKK